MPAHRRAAGWNHPFWGALLACAVVSSSAVACPYSIRDSAFIGHETPATFRLLLLTRSDAPQRVELADWFDTAQSAWLGDANVKAELIDIDSQAGHEARRVVPSDALAGDRLPLAILVAPDGRTLLLEDLSDDELSLDVVMEVVARTVDSPLRRELGPRMPQAWCALVLIEGDDADINQRALAAAEDASRRITGTTTEMDKVVAVAPEIVTLSPDNPDERVFLWSLGLEAFPNGDAPRLPRLLMLAGRGERRGPVLAGDEIDAASVYDLVHMLGRNCTCTTEAHWLSGPVIPLEWTPEMQDAARAALGFDPDNPEAVGVIGDVEAGLSGLLGGGGAGLGYREASLEPARDASRASTSASSTAASTTVAESSVAQSPDAGRIDEPRVSAASSPLSIDDEPSPSTSTALATHDPSQTPATDDRANAAVSPVLWLVGAGGLALIVATIFVLRRSATT